MNNVEVEIRSFLSPERFAVLLERLKLEGEYLGEDDQVTYYFDCEQDVRIQKNSKGAKIWMKGGALHDEHRNELEVSLNGCDFENIERIFSAMGHGVEMKWFRTRHTFLWRNISVMLDCTKGYGNIIELEKMSDEDNKEAVLSELKMLLAELGVPQTPRHEFQNKYEHYRLHWKELTEETEKVKDPA